MGMALDVKQRYDGRVKIVNTSSRSIKLAVRLSGGHRRTEINDRSYEDLGLENSFDAFFDLYKEGKKEELLELWKRRREKSKYLAIELEPGEEYPVPWRIK
ncbi:MAG: hypothetical protein CSA07_05585 [Bacteroidia bacterium]|nr:MAG: hypothetical protein CSA07_05585 [Bacteroidia bacterium]